MSSRKRRASPMEKSTKIRKRRKPRLKLEDAPPVKSIKDLIEIGKSVKFYKNLDTLMLWKVIPYLEQLENMIGMESLKETVFFQVIYYLQKMHTRTKNEEYLHTLILGPPGSGKCLAKDTKVIMYDGSMKNVQDIRKDELLMGDDSLPRKVESICHGKEMMYKVKQFYGDDYVVNESHILSLKLDKNPWYTDEHKKRSYYVYWYTEKGTHVRTFPYNKNKRKVLSYIEGFMKTLPQKGNIINIPVVEYLKRSRIWKSVYKGFKVEIKFPEKFLDIDPYILGLWLGSKNYDNKSFRYTNNSHINDHIVDFCKQNHFRLIRNISKNTYEIQDFMCKNNRFRQRLKGHSLLNNGHIPNVYKFNSKKNRLQLLAGLIDSCGFLNKNTFELTLNETLNNDILWICRSVGLRAIIKKSTVYFDGNTSIIPCKRTNNCTEINKNNLVYPIKVRALKEGEYYGFSLDDDSNKRFLLGDFTVTHNTEVAKIIGKIYQSMGILSRSGPFKIVHRDDFVAEYLGQTAIKTKKLLKSCLGGVMFIDEVYSLAPVRSDRDSFAKAAIDTLTGFLSEHKNDFCCIAAGYEENVRGCFFGMNQGLERRFPWVHTITEYSSVELSEIFLKMVNDIEWEYSLEIKQVSEIIEKNKDLFKHAGGDIETFLSKCKMMHSRRVFSLGNEHKFVLTMDDLEQAIEYIRVHKKENNDKPPDGMFM